MELARHSGRAIISADSRQIYRHFDIGTAKPSVLERETVPHYGVDIIDATERYSAHAWATDAASWISAARDAGRDALIVGGTGFYIRALVEPLAPAPSVDSGRRRLLEAWFDSQHTESLRRWCLRLDPSRAQLGRTQLIRAVETALLTGTRLGDAHAAQQHTATDAKALAVHYLVVDPGVSLGERIRSRVHAMVEHGWPDEVRALMERVPTDAPGWLASGYGVMRQHVLGEVRRDEAIERIVIETRQYAKRQRTWFRHQLSGDVTRISSSDPHAIDQALAWLKALESDAR
jgi:tRNA dimethylallyltransferase